MKVIASLLLIATILATPVNYSYNNEVASNQGYDIGKLNAEFKTGGSQRPIHLDRWDGHFDDYEDYHNDYYDGYDRSDYGYGGY
jgi:hypothetical protein